MENNNSLLNASSLYNNTLNHSRFDDTPTHLYGKEENLGPVVGRLISANPGLNFNPGLFFFSSKAFSRTIFSILFRVANHQIVDKKN